MPILSDYHARRMGARELRATHLSGRAHGLTWCGMFERFSRLSQQAVRAHVLSHGARTEVECCTKLWLNEWLVQPVLSRVLR